MPTTFRAGQRLTADQLQRVVPDRVTQGSDQTVASSTTLVDSSIVVTVDGLMRIDLEIRYTSAGGGITWDWSETGSITMSHRGVGSAGSSTSGSPTNVADMYWRSAPTLDFDITVAHFSTSSTQRGSEQIVVDGSGTLTLRFAQETSNGGDTTLSAESYAMITRLGS